MSDSIFLRLATQEGLKATEAEADAMAEVLYTDEYYELLDGTECHGLEIGYCSSCELLFVFSDKLDFEWRDTVPKRFLALLGNLIAKNGLDYLTVIESMTDADGGEPIGEVQIRADGSIRSSKLLWEIPPKPEAEGNRNLMGKDKQ